MRWLRFNLAYPVIVAGVVLLAARSGGTDRGGIHAVTTNGVRVTLFPDGTWKYDEIPDSNSAYNREATATDENRLAGVHVSFWFDPSRWTIEHSDEKQMVLRGPDGPDRPSPSFALLISEGRTVAMSMLRETVIADIESHLQAAQIVMDNTRTINGVAVGCIRIEGTSVTQPAGITGLKLPAATSLTAYGCYYSGAAGTVMITTFTPTELFPGLRPALTAFLDGLVIHEDNNAHP